MNIISKAVMAIVAVMALTTMSASAGDKFAGVYAGVQTGYSNIGVGSFDVDGVDYGLFAGYNTPVLERFVVGLETDFTLSSVNFESLVDVRHAFGVYGRLGYKLTDTTLVYGKAGFVTTNVSFGGESDTAEGIRAGVGFDSFITESFFVRLEGSYTDYARLGGFESDQYRATVGLGYKF